jgi:hypothetical protein
VAAPRSRWRLAATEAATEVVSEAAVASDRGLRGGASSGCSASSASQLHPLAAPRPSKICCCAHTPAVAQRSSPRPPAERGSSQLWSRMHARASPWPLQQKVHGLRCAGAIKVSAGVSAAREGHRVDGAWRGRARQRWLRASRLLRRRTGLEQPHLTLARSRRAAGAHGSAPP